MRYRSGLIPPQPGRRTAVLQPPFRSTAASVLMFTRRRRGAEKVAGKALSFFASASPSVVAGYTRAAKFLDL